MTMMMMMMMMLLIFVVGLTTIVMIIVSIMAKIFRLALKKTTGGEFRVYRASIRLLQGI